MTTEHGARTPCADTTDGEDNMIEHDDQDDQIDDDQDRAGFALQNPANFDAKTARRGISLPGKNRPLCWQWAMMLSQSGQRWHA
jgi:hypothetical protein